MKNFSLERILDVTGVVARLFRVKSSSLDQILDVAGDVIGLLKAKSFSLDKILDVASAIGLSPVPMLERFNNFLEASNFLAARTVL